MQFDINQNNLYLLLPSKVSRIADYLALKDNIGVIDAIKCVYSSNTPIGNSSKKAQKCGILVRWRCMRNLKKITECSTIGYSNWLLPLRLPGAGATANCVFGTCLPPGASHQFGTRR